MNRISEATQIILRDAERTELEGLARSTKTEHRLRQRARIVLLAAGATATRAIGRKVGLHDGHGIEACPRADGDDGCGMLGGGWPVSTKPAIVATRLNTRPTRGGAFCGFWTRGRLMATAVERALAAHDKRSLPGRTVDRQSPRRCRSPLSRGQASSMVGACPRSTRDRPCRAQELGSESNDPEFAAKAAGVVGLYRATPENAVIISVDEKPSIQPLERRQGYLKMPDGRADLAIARL